MASSTIATEQQGLSFLGQLSKIIPALQSIPILGTIIGVAQSVLSVFGASHAAAVQKQAKSMQLAVPTFYQQTQAVMNALNSGQMSESQAIAALGQVQATYYANVANFIKQSGPLKPFDYVGTSAPANPSHCVIHDPGNWKDCDAGQNCNAGCAFGAGATAAIEALKGIITAGEGSYTMPLFVDSVDGLNVPPTTWTYARANFVTVFDRQIEGVFGITPSATNTTADYFLFAFIVAVGVFALWGVWHFGKRIVA